jgi:hypothetical protein
MFGITPSFEIKGRKKFKTWLGAFISFLAIAEIIVYAAQKFGLVEISFIQDSAY